MNPIYPLEFRCGGDLPTDDQFEVTSVSGKVGKGVRAKRAFARGSRVACFTGQLMPHVMQHTLQVSPQAHLHDPWFVGLLTHSCAPNCILDMQRLEIWALVDVEPGQLLTIDYAVTEDVLHRQFACGCGSAACRKWITGRRETVNDMGRAYLDGLAQRKVRRMQKRVMA